MRELLFRTLYAFLLIFVYLIGRCLNPMMKHHLYEIDISLLLPLLSLVFYDYFLRSVSNRFVSLRLAATPYIDTRKMVVPIRILYTGARVHSVKVKYALGPRDVNLFLKYPRAVDAKLCVPEGFTLPIGPESPIIEFDLLFYFRSTPEFSIKPWPYKIWSRRPFLPAGLTLEIGNRVYSKRWHIPEG